jgi:PKD domain
MERGFRCGVRGSSARSAWSLTVAVTAALVLVFSLPAQAATDALDQSQTLTIGSETVGSMAQTFTAGMTGQLDRVSLVASMIAGAGTVSVQSVSGAFPAGTVLGTTSFGGALTGNRQFHDFAFTPAISIKAGLQYAIVVAMGGRSKLTWYNSNGYDAYSAGQLYIGCATCAWGTDTLHGGDFAFETWVIGGSANQAPVVAAASSTVSVSEGTAPVNTGTFSDPDSDTVALAASSGTITQTGTSSGTWSWTSPATDEASSQTITITANDGKGLTANAGFTSTVVGVRPTATIAAALPGLAANSVSTSAPTSSPEGTAVTLNGSGSSPSAEDNAAGFTYGWTVTKNGAPFGTGSAAAFSFTPDDEGTFVATLQVTDDGGMTGATSVTVTGANVAPTAKIRSITWTPQLVLTANEPVNFAGAFTDPGTLDTHTASWSFGDGAVSATSTADSAPPSASHSYGAPGTYTVTLTVTDDDQGVGQATGTVTVETPQQALTSIAGSVQGIKSLNAGQKNSLIAKLNAASASVTRSDTTAATNQLNAFLHELHAEVSAGLISTTDAEALSAAVNQVQAAVGTYNRFLSWIGGL